MRGCAVSFVRGGCTLNLQWASMFELALLEFRGMGMHSVVSGDLSGLQRTHLTRKYVRRVAHTA